MMRMGAWVAIMMELERVEDGRVQRIRVRTRPREAVCYRAIHCPGSFEDRFYDPDHPKDSDWVSDIDPSRLFMRKSERGQFVR